MTPKDKALELMFKMHNFIYDIPVGEPEFTDLEFQKVAKQCAIIHIDEMLKLADEVAGIDKQYFRHPDTGDYIDADKYEDWLKEVKTELDKL